MRPTRRLLATAMGGGPSGGPGRPSPPMALLPPITLYRRILRSHRKHLQPRMRLLGDEYVRAEFRAHRGVENPAHLVREKKFPSIPPHPPFFHSFFFLGGLPRFDRYPLLFGLAWGLTRECAPRVGVGEIIDWLSYRVAALRAEDRGRYLGGREAGPAEGREDERCVCVITDVMK